MSIDKETKIQMLSTATLAFIFFLGPLYIGTAIWGKENFGWGCFIAGIFFFCVGFWTNRMRDKIYYEDILAEREK